MRRLLLAAAVWVLLLPGVPIRAQDDEAGAPPSPPPPPQASGPTTAGTPTARSLDELLDLVEEGFSEERRENRQREVEFEQAHEQQEQLLAEALAEVDQEQRRSQRLENAFSENETALAQMNERKTQRLGNLGELFGVVRQVAGDLQGLVRDSVTSSQFPDREDILEKLGRGAELPTTEDLERLWFELHREMTQQGKIVRYPAVVLTTEGDEEQRDVVRAGLFAVVSQGEYLLWDSAIQKVRELNRQPPTRYLQTVEPYETADGDAARPLAVDPSRGSLLMALIDTPNARERIQQGGAVGYAIIAIGVAALFVGIAKWVHFAIAGSRVRAQRQRSTIRADNPLGRVLGVYEENKTLDPEALGLKLDQAVLAEAERLDRFMWLVRVVSVVAPLMGLLGTVTGMIQTFQSITLFGAGDPKMMAGGISEALVTTMLGLMTAAPLVLLYAFLSTSRRRIVSMLTGQSAGLVAMRVEDSGV